ncbi:transposase [Simiduia aestuariiviva]|uniref:Putative transposase n=1 Tax=Simiduia aestuariiviva TaxID=1510459 RepID=A0A839UJF9_9GAMM|nr:transposase [Simiduia aestuariiviva]MBB3167992.1 putative transposase [Simiduia aestuariiviva]
MARLPRLNLPDIPQHVVQTGHNNLPCFFDDEDYEFYLQSLQAAAEQYRVDIHAYVLLPNMVQFIATPRIEQGLSSMMQSLGRRYVQYINHRYRRSGTLWGGRYKSSLIDSDAYLLTCYRYVELKPMYLGLANEPGEYPWSSFNYHTSINSSPLIKDHRLYLELGKTARERIQEYRKLFRYAFDNRLLVYIAETVKLGQVLGGDAFKDRIEKIANQRVRPLKRGRPRKRDNKATDGNPPKEANRDATSADLEATTSST